MLTDLTLSTKCEATSLINLRTISCYKIIEKILNWLTNPDSRLHSTCIKTLNLFGGLINLSLLLYMLNLYDFNVSMRFDFII